MGVMIGFSATDLSRLGRSPEETDTRYFWLRLLGILLLSAVLRLLFFQGMNGGDDLIYFMRASEIAHDVWKSSNYIGELRYGTNIPIAAAISLFGPNLYSAALIPLICSLGEIAVVGVTAKSGWGQRAALCATFVLCCVPLHINTATNIHADPILSLTITAAFALFWAAERRDKALIYFCAGLAAGYAYWVKEASVLFLLSFGLYIIVVRRWSWRWLYSGVGALLAFAANSTLMWIVSGHPFHVLTVMHSTVETQWTAADRANSPFFYFKYLFFDIRHTWLLGYLAVIGVSYVFLRRGTMTYSQRAFATYVLVWSAGLLLAFSIVPVSFSPIRFVMKQTNYMMIFLAPLAILSGFGLAQMRADLRNGALLLVAAGGFVIPALTQQDLRAFTANAQAASVFAKSHPNDIIYGNWWVSTISQFHAELDWPNTDHFIRKLRDLPPVVHSLPGQKLLVIIDHETYGRPVKSVDPPSIPSCWVQFDVLRPQGFGIGATVTRGLVGLLQFLPDGKGDHLSRPFRGLLHPAAAEVYLVSQLDPWCRNSAHK